MGILQHFTVIPPSIKPSNQQKSHLVSLQNILSLTMPILSSAANPASIDGPHCHTQVCFSS